jgi:hypothetical protein
MKKARKKAGASGEAADPMQARTSLGPSERRSMAKQILEGYALTREEQEIFLQSAKRVNKVLGIEKHREARIVTTIVDSEACIAGHARGDRIVFDSMGRLVSSTGDKPVCIRLLNRAWYRLIMVLDRMADDAGEALGDGGFAGEVIEVRLSCFGAPFPYGDCGQVLMEFSVEGLG